jgi:hypothetical protein
MTLKVANVYVYRCRWIREPHNKIALCFCNQKNWVFFFNSKPVFHGIAQLEVQKEEHPKALTKTCFLDLFEVLSMAAPDIASAQDREPISSALLDRIIAVLEEPVETLAPANQELALNNLRNERLARGAA